MKRSKSSKNLAYEMFFTDTALTEGVNFISGITRIENNSVIHVDNPGDATLLVIHAALNNGLNVSVSKSNSSGFLISDINFSDDDKKNNLKCVFNASLGESIECHIKNIRSGEADIVVLGGLHGYDDMRTNWTLGLFDALVKVAKDKRVPIVMTFNSIYDGYEDRLMYEKFKNFSAKDVVEKHAPFTGSGQLDSILFPHLNMFIRLIGPEPSSIAWRDPHSGIFTCVNLSDNSLISSSESKNVDRQIQGPVINNNFTPEKTRIEYESMLLGGFTKSVVSEVFSDYDLMLLGFRR